MEDDGGTGKDAFEKFSMLCGSSSAGGGEIASKSGGRGPTAADGNSGFTTDSDGEDKVTDEGNGTVLVADGNAGGDEEMLDACGDAIAEFTFGESPPVASATRRTVDTGASTVRPCLN